MDQNVRQQLQQKHQHQIHKGPSETHCTLQITHQETNAWYKNIIKDSLQSAKEPIKATNEEPKHVN